MHREIASSGKSSQKGSGHFCLPTVKLVFRATKNTIWQECMKHWTEPNGILLIKIPTDWQYLNSGLSDYEEKSPYGFQPYENPIGCFQLSCYPLSELAPSIAKANPNGVRELSWKESR